ncbi:unnamed protein product [Heterobilharzia americana]|nr:unnamed protein product [Heterobilharzia americana]
MVSSPLIVFFDTFTHNRLNQESVDCVRFKSGIELVKICILPFGSVVESNLSDEPLLGATNPASFDIKIYSNSQINCIVLQNVVKYQFNEKLGINTIYFKKPVQSNFLLFRGMYSTLTVALFGLPPMSLSVQSLAPATNLSIPPPTIGITLGCVETTTPMFYAPNKVPEIQTEQNSDVPTTWQQCNVQSNLPESYAKTETLNICSIQSVTDPTSVHPIVENELEEKIDEQKTMNMETTVFMKMAKSRMLITKKYPQMRNYSLRLMIAKIWRLVISSQILKKSMRSNLKFPPYTNGFSCEFHRIADPTLTLFELHYWLLERASSKDQLPSENEVFHRNSDEVEVESNINLLPPPDDWTDASQSADFLVTMTKKYCSESSTGFHEEWIDSLDTVSTHLAQGLAFLYCTDRNLYQGVTETLLLWVYSGLNMDLALNQPNSSYIVKHITAGVNFAGLMTSATTSELASALLYPTTVQNDCDTCTTQMEGLQVQHILLNLLESPLITTPLRLAICRALDQTTRLPIGLNAFLGIKPVDSDQKVNVREDIMSFDCLSPKTQTSPNDANQSTAVKMDDEENEQCNGQVKWDECPKKEQVDDVQMPENPFSSNKIQSPYQRFIFIVSGSKNSRVTAAYERLLNKVHTYELLSEFRKSVNQFQTIGKHLYSDNNSLPKLLELENILVSQLRKITHIFQNAEQVIANPRSSLPSPLLLNESKRISHNPYADLCSMIDSCDLIDSLTQMTNKITNINEDVLQESGSDDLYEVNISSLVIQIQVSIHELLFALCSHPFGLLLLAYRPESTSLLIKACLETFSNAISKDNMSNNKSFAANFFVLGLELTYKIEALRYLDLLIDWTRKKGMTGVYSFITQLQSETVSADLRSIEASIRDALFGLTRLMLNCVGQFRNFMNTDYFTDSGADDHLSNLKNVKEFVLSTLTTSSPIWIADLIAMDDYFAPLLMLIEALSEHDMDMRCGGNNTVKALPKTEKSKSSNDETKPSTQPNTDQCLADGQLEVPNILSSKATIRNLLSGPIQLNSLVNTLVITVLRHSENISYLDRYGPRLAQLITPHQQTESVEDITPIDVFTQMTSFARLASSYISWLRDGSFTLSPEACSWLIGQLQTMCNELNEALDTLLGLEVAEDLLAAPNASTSQLTYSGRRQSTTQVVTAGRCIPPSILLILRLLRTHILGSSHSIIFDRLSHNHFSEQQIILSRTHVLIEIFSMNGLNTFITLIQKLSDFFILQLQATLSQANNTIDLISINSCNSNVSLIFSMFDNVIQIVGAVLRTIIPVQGDDFQDTRILRPLFHAYACTVFAYCPPGPKAAQLERIRDCTIAGLLAYTHSELNRVLNIQEINKSLWVLMLKELIQFTISSPCFYLPGLLIFLDLLPLPLPIVTVPSSFTSDDESKINSSRDIWAAHLLAISSDLIGMIQLLSATISSPNNLLFCNLFKFVERLVDIGLPFASLLANACLDAINDIFYAMNSGKRLRILTNLFLRLKIVYLSYFLIGHIIQAISGSHIDKETNDRNALNEEDSLEKLCSKPGDSPSYSANKADNSVSELNTPSTKLLLNPLPVSDPRLSSQELRMDSNRNNPITDSTSATSVQQQIKLSNTNMMKFSVKQIDSAELNAALSMLFILLKIPTYRHAVLDALRQSFDRHPENATTTEDKCSSPDPSYNNLRRQNFLNVVDSVLSDCSDKHSCISVQLKLLQCLSLLVDVKLSVNNSKWNSNVVKQLEDPTENESQSIADNLPDLCFLRELVLILIKHINHPDRDMTTLPSALDPLIIITDHDPGFAVVKEALDSPIAIHNGHHLFANLVQRVNDCFSADNPDCQATLTGCLRLIQSLVTDHSTLPLTFISKCTYWNESEELDVKLSDSQTDAKSVEERSNLFTRQLHISGERVRELLGWSGNGDHGKPVRDLHALLEMLADDEPSLEYLRSGMKNLLSLLSHEYDIPELKELTNIAATATNEEDLSDESISYKLRSRLPNARPLDTLMRDRQKFVKLTLDNIPEKTCDQLKYFCETLSAAHDKIFEDIEMELPTGGSKLIGTRIPASISCQNDLVHCDLSDIATHSCNGLRIRDELAKCGHHQDSGEVAIRHQKRRRGQSTIIQTGTSFRKFVAPMRGRGFMLRNTAPSNPASGNTAPVVLGSTVGQLSTNVAGIRVDPFRSRPLNTSRPPSLHVDDFTKLEKEEGIIEDSARPRPYRDTRIMRVSRGARFNAVRGTFSGHNASNLPNMSNIPFGMKVPALDQLHITPLLPNWSLGNRSVPLLPFSLEPRTNQERRERHGR